MFMTTFIKWFLLASLTITALFFAEQRGALSLIITNDRSFLAVAIMTLFVITSTYVGTIAYKVDVASTKEKDRLNKQANLGWFCAEHFFSLGLLGTIIGLCLATQGSMDATKPVSDIVAGLKSGLNTAFYTTICGIVFSLLLQVQLLIVKIGLQK